ncbi:MAG: hypothetical protein KAT65_02485 [Methanophagales archaeon]|nr:hypothetical protein [Methanophagales archaeon]
MDTEKYATEFREKVIRNIRQESLGIEPTISPNDNESKEIDAPSSAILLTEENCKGCAWAKEALSKDIEEGKIRVCDLNNEECKQIGRSIDLKEVPAMVIEDENGKLVQCEMGKEEGSDNLLVQCPVMPNRNVEEAPRKPPKHGKIGISCVGWNLKNILMVEAKNYGATQEDIFKINSLPECESSELGFAPIKSGKGATDTQVSPRNKFMRECLRDKTKGDRQPDRMRACSKEYREVKEAGKIK